MVERRDRSHAAAKQRANPSLGERLAEILGKSTMVKICKTCADARRPVEDYLPPSVVINAMLELAEWTLATDKGMGF
ncbi:hypothetical protein C2134_06975 [Chromobacterium sinusclupearum]|uniref:Uncharacterized protein n=1 Tax=Chromobacterium sinusclupearum TaxID=2077146 RepID=A0A2K4MQP5_9NEIS|nr:hypothetical protein [Chromobacterium sinusclupearum]POA99312.1 hypothetical protein C2134_06975 [Chromobacterium sinusclupearum]